MIVEDEVLIAFGLEEAFEDEGYEVRGPFSSCSSALADLATTRPDLAVVDVTLSDGSCVDLVRELRQRDVPVMIYSGREAVAEHAPELAGLTWIDKPSEPALVIRASRRLLGTGAAAGTPTGISGVGPPPP